MEQLKTTVNVLPHPLICVGRETHHTSFTEGETLGEYAERNNVNIPLHSFVVSINGFVIEEGWQNIVPKTGDTILVQAIVEGGGGGGKILRTIAMIAVVVIAAWVTGGAGGALVANSMAASVGGALVMMGGTMLINALLPPPSLTDKNEVDAGKSQEERYGVSGGDNPIRLYEPMSIVFGTVKISPDFSMKPYTVFSNNDQYLYQAFNLGVQPHLTYSDFKIGTNNLSDYKEARLFVSDAEGKLPIPSNVDTQEGFEVKTSDGWIVRKTSTDTTSIGLDVVGQAYTIDKKTGKVTGGEVALEVSIRAVGTEEWFPCGSMNITSTSDLATHYWSYGYWTAGKTKVFEGGSGNGDSTTASTNSDNNSNGGAPASSYGSGGGGVV